MSSTTNQSLPIGYELQGYKIGKVLSAGGFSYVYLATDADGNTVAIKEYLPNGLALRADGDQVVMPAAEASHNFRHGLKCFFEEGRALANINHKNIVRVLNFFRANDTVYMVMQYERGKSLQECILGKNEAVPENSVRRLFTELLNGLREVHTHKLLHLDIKPANIYIRQDGSPVLLDFGSARQTLNQSNAQLAPSFTPGFAPPEQYNQQELLGPWSDIYSIGATIYACLARTAPPAATDRLKHDQIVPAEKLGKDIYSSNLLRIIDNCLALDHLERPQSIYALQKSLQNDLPETDAATDRKPGIVGRLLNMFQ
ncbi:MAG: serine/threonine protein kinase [Pseudomonadota bacterium]